MLNTSTPVTQENNSMHILMGDIRITVTQQPWRFLHLNFFTMKSPFTNILRFSSVIRKFRITIDTELYPSVNAHLNDGTIIIFKQCIRWLYYFDRTNMEHNIINSQVTDCALLDTVDSNKAYFHQCEIKGADKAIIPQQIVGWPST